MEQELNLYQKLAKIRDMSNVVKKEKSAYNYKYASLPEIMANVTAGMKKYNVSLVPMIMPDKTEIEQTVTKKVKFTKSGEKYEDIITEYLIRGDMLFRWVNDENPEEFIDIPWYFSGSQSDPSMAGGSALSYYYRYFLINFFGIALVDLDVDSYRSKQKSAEQKEELEIASEIVKQIDSLIRQYLADHPDKKEEVMEFAKKYAAKGNYLTIKDSILAAKMLGAFNETFLKEEK